MNVKKALSAAVALMVFVIIALAAADTAPWKEQGAGTGDDMDALVQALFTDHVITLEVLGILLTAALIGALTIARPIGIVDDGDDAETPSDERTEATPLVAMPLATEHSSAEEEE